MSDAMPGPASRGASRSTLASQMLRPQTHLFDAPTIRAFDAPHEVTQLLEAAVDQANAEARRLEHVLIVGPAGSGKQVLARAVVRELAQRAAEVDGECVESLEHLMELVRTLRARDVLLIRNIDRMAKRGQRHLSIMLGERLAPRSARPNRPRFAERDPDAPREAIADFTLLCTAADASKVQPVVRQAMELRVHLATPTVANMRAGVTRSLALQGARMDTASVDQLVASCAGREECAECIVRAAALLGR